MERFFGTAIDTNGCGDTLLHSGLLQFSNIGFKNSFIYFLNDMIALLHAVKVLQTIKVLPIVSKRTLVVIKIFPLRWNESFLLCERTVIKIAIVFKTKPVAGWKKCEIFPDTLFLCLQNGVSDNINKHTTHLLGSQNKAKLLPGLWRGIWYLQLVSSTYLVIVLIQI